VDESFWNGKLGKALGAEGTDQVAANRFRNGLERNQAAIEDLFIRE
jgi:hypothetical protein